MAQSRGIKEYLPPIKGLNTSLSPRQESAEYFTSGRNMRARTNPLRMQPREGISVSKLLSADDSYIAATPQTSVDISFGEWRTPNNDKDKSFVWIKSGTLLYFVDVETLNVHTESVDLTDALSGTALGTSANLASSRVEAKNIKGNLLVVGEAIDPVLIAWDGTNITAFTLNIVVRDILGIDDGLDVDERPSTLSEKHEYNLYNQGWYKERRIVASGSPTDPVVAFFNDKGVYPSNADISHLAVVDDGAGELIFDSDFLEDLTFGNSRAPRGHYTLDAFDMNRETRRSSPLVSGLGTGGSGGSSDLIGNSSSSSGSTVTTPPYDDFGELTIEP